MTLGSPIFRKLLLSAFVLIAATLLVVDSYLTRHAARREVQAVEQRLAAQARVLQPEASAAPLADLEMWARRAGQRAQTRITIIDAQGAVLADSEHDPETMENHGSRPEVQQARQGRIGTAIRRSATLGRDLCYVAMPLERDGRSDAVLRLAVPLEELDAAIAEIRWAIVKASAAAALLALGVAYLFSRRFTSRIGELQRYAEALTQARFSETPPAGANDELGALARALGRMAGQLRELVDRLSQESARRESVLASMGEGVLAVDRDLRVTFCNHAFARVVGAREPVAEGMPMLELIRDPALLDMLQQALATGEPKTDRLTLPAAEGRSFEVQAAPMGSPRRRGAIAILHDITELERLERVRKDFVANVSHELRTPLTAILGYAETLLDGALEDPENNRRFLEIIRTHAVRLSSIAADLLTLSELEAGKSAAPEEAISVPAAVDAALRAVEPEARQRGVNLARGAVQEAKIRGDRVRLEQVLVNLLSNAVKFNRPGGDVRVEAARAGDGKVRIAVIDTGIGIPSGEILRIFERFYRVDKARSREVGGTGLGLSIVKHAVERMNGAVQVESQLGRGSTFTVVLPTA